MRFFSNLIKCVLLVGGLTSGGLWATQPTENTEKPVTNAVLRTASIYVKNWDASVRFYRDYLGYDVLVDQPVTTQKSLDTIGVGDGGTARIAYLKPRNDRITRPFTGNYLALIEVAGPALEGRTYERSSPVTQAMRGEIVLAHQVVGIDQVFASMQLDAAVTIVAPLSLSGAGQSRSFSAIDPNGVRVEMYEYIPGKEPAKNP